LECGHLPTVRKLRFCSRSRKDRRWPRVFRGPKLPIERRCQRQWRSPGERCRGWPICIWLRQAIAQFRRWSMEVVWGRMLRHVVSLATRGLLVRAGGSLRPLPRLTEVKKIRVDYRASGVRWTALQILAFTCGAVVAASAARAQVIGPQDTPVGLGARAQLLLQIAGMDPLPLPTLRKRSYRR